MSDENVLPVTPGWRWILLALILCSFVFACLFVRQMLRLIALWGATARQERLHEFYQWFGLRPSSPGSRQDKH